MSTGPSPKKILCGFILKVAKELFITPKPFNLALTHSVVAICAVLFSKLGSGAVGIPENDGEFMLAL